MERKDNKKAALLALLALPKDASYEAFAKARDLVLEGAK